MAHQGKTYLLSLVAICAYLSAISPAAVANNDADLEAKARDIHDRVLTFDSEVDIPTNFVTEIDPGTRTELQVDLVKMREGGLDAAAFVVWSSQTPRTPENYAEIVKQGKIKLNAITKMANDLYPDQIEIAYKADDFARINGAGKLVALIGMVNGYLLGPDFQELQSYYDAGLRYVAFTHAGHNDLADSARPNPAYGDAPTEHGGISETGRKLIAEMNRLGIIVDVSQVTMDALKQMAEASQAPVVATHSSVYSLVPNPRNITDEGLLAIKETGGVVQIVAFSGYLIDTGQEMAQGMADTKAKHNLGPTDSPLNLPPAEQAAYFADFQAMIAALPQANVAQLVDHIDYAVDLLGIDHVGIASDFEHGGGVIGWMDASQTFNVTKELVKRGYNEEDIAKIWAGNFLRVLAEVEEVSARLQ